MQRLVLVSLAAAVEDRLHQLPGNPAADTRLRGRRIDVPQGSGRLPHRDPEAAAAARLGGDGVRPAIDRAFAGRPADETARAPDTATADGDAHQRAAGSRAPARAGAAGTDSGPREFDHPGPPR